MMKRLLILSVLILGGTGILYTQVPRAFKYQAIARDESGNVVADQIIDLRISILKARSEGEASYIETHQVKSSMYGLINLVIGEGRMEKGDFEDINWGDSKHYIKMEMDIGGNGNYQNMGASQIYAVPYALYAETAGSIINKELIKTARVQNISNNNNSSSSNSGTRQGTPNTKFPGDGDSWMNENIGKVGVGMTDPEEKLDINGNLKADRLILQDQNGDHWEVEVDTNGNIQLNYHLEQCGDPLYDPRNDKWYQTVLIGVQCWMAENLNIGTGIHGSGNQNDNDIIEKYCYNNNITNCVLYGGLYQWDEAMQYVTVEGAQGICPNGWHIPTYDEWEDLKDFLDTNSGGKMKTTGTIDFGDGLWYDPNTGADNTSGFTGRPGGYRDHSTGDFEDRGYNAHFWTTKQYDVANRWHRILAYDHGSLAQNVASKYTGYSVRCLKD